MACTWSNAARCASRSPDAKGGVPLALLSDGDIFGEGALLLEGPRSASARAVTDLDAWMLRREDFEDLMLQYPALALNLSRVLEGRLRSASRTQQAPAAYGAEAAAVVAAPVAVAAKPAKPAKAAKPASASAAAPGGVRGAAGQRRALVRERQHGDQSPAHHLGRARDLPVRRGAAIAVDRFGCRR